MRVRRVIATDKGYDLDAVQDRDSLRGRKLRYDDRGLTNLTAPINDEFFRVGSRGVSPREMVGSSKVVNIAERVDARPIGSFK